MKIIKKLQAKSGRHEDQSYGAGLTPKTPHLRDPLAYAVVLKALG